ncbi:MAG: proline racemase family protein [Bacillota bacterium]|nr:proline racemase family protein [Bacillota bacterium]
MAFKQHVFAIDAHTAGEAARIVIGPLMWKKCANMSEKKAYFEQHYDKLRRSLMFEPKGHDNMFGSVISEACDPEADYGIFFIESGGCLNMCGHGTIASVTAMIELGIIDAGGQSEKVVKVDTPAGLVTTTAHIEGDKVVGVSFQNVPSFLYKKDCHINLPEYGDIRFDISFGGSFFAAVPIEQFALAVDINNADKLSDIAMQLKHLINEQIPVRHPTQPIDTVDLISLYTFDKEQRRLHSCVVFGLGQIDRSPCGTSTCAMTALMYNKGIIGIDEFFTSESIMGTQFKARAVRELEFNGYRAIIPEVTGTGYVLGTQHFFIDDRDPFVEGFTFFKE